MELTKAQPLPYRLRIAAKKAGMDPKEWLAQVIVRHDSFDEAAEELGISRITLIRWRKRLGITVKKGAAA